MTCRADSSSAGVTLGASKRGPQPAASEVSARATVAVRRLPEAASLRRVVTMPLPPNSASKVRVGTHRVERAL